MAQALQSNEWISDISRAFTVQVLIEYLLVWDRLQEVQLVENQPDQICWKWTDKIFSFSSAYSAFFIAIRPSLLGSIRSREPSFYGKPVRQPSASFLSGWCCMSAAGLQLVGRGMDSKTMIHVCSVINLLKR